MSLVTNLQSAFTRVATEFKSIRILIGGTGTSDISNLNTTTKASLVAAINEVNSKPAGAQTFANLTDVSLNAVADGNFVRYDSASGKWKNVVGSTYFQPRDSDLDSIAALTTTNYGRNLLTTADQAALTALIAQGTTAAAGILQLATGAEGTTGTDNAKAITAAVLKAVLDARIAAMDAFVAKGGIDASTNPNYPAGNAGDTYRITVGGRIGGAAGPEVEPGDLIQLFVDNSAAGNHAAVGANWDVVQVNIVGAVTGPAASVNGNLPAFSGTGGKSIVDSGFSVDTDVAMASSSATKLPTTQGVRGFTYDKATIGDPTTDFTAGFVAALS